MNIKLTKSADRKAGKAPFILWAALLLISFTWAEKGETSSVPAPVAELDSFVVSTSSIERHGAYGHGKTDENSKKENSEEKDKNAKKDSDEENVHTLQGFRMIVGTSYGSEDGTPGTGQGGWGDSSTDNQGNTHSSGTDNTAAMDDPGENSTASGHGTSSSSSDDTYTLPGSDSGSDGDPFGSDFLGGGEEDVTGDGNMPGDPNTGIPPGADGVTGDTGTPGDPCGAGPNGDSGGMSLIILEPTIPGLEPPSAR